MSTVLVPVKKTSQENSIYTSEDLSLVLSLPIPKHIAIIMDGNRRWAERNHLPIEAGHVKGAEQLKKIVTASMELGIERLTVYSFSTENRNRPAGEVSLLLSLFKKYLIQEREEMKENGIKLDTIGDLSLFPADLQKTINESKVLTEKSNKFNLVLAVNYGARDEIKRAVQIIVQKQISNPQKEIQVTEELIQSCLDTAGWSDPELLIRTSGEIRLSNFLLWQISYTEIYFTETYWPEFNPDCFLEAITNYQNRKIRRGL
ncbi:MAG: Ditrans,polycis-undecaprenyl-diphosphate synthase ((2E,6E)-farnesyl-diphosphate specific) [Chlamydiae bacterium]|nr:Ditrans,polycis-undecaprenyl-diphosphate synthase ((2E,6E)-farnesyl-diphosphate specific) [Chlamydiota bacterium]